MGISIVDFVIDTLKNNGVRAECARPAGNLMTVQDVVAAVSILRMDQEKQCITVQVDVICPDKYDAKRCEDRALQICQVLQRTGGVCRQENCTYMSTVRAFCIPVWVSYHGQLLRDVWEGWPELLVTVGGEYLMYMVSFTAERVYPKPAAGTTPSPPAATQEETWSFRLEEYYPAGAEEAQTVKEPFSISLECGDASEVYSGCVLTGFKRVTDASGVRQIRTGTSNFRSRTVRA